MQAFRIAGLPLHPAIVHFPIAAWTFALLGDGVYLFNCSQLWWQITYWAIATGVVTGLLAMVAGLVELPEITNVNGEWRTAMLHMGFMSGAWSAFTINLLLRDLHNPMTTMDFWLPGTLSVSGVILLVLGGHLGARLVYHHNVARKKGVGEKKGR